MGTVKNRKFGVRSKILLFCKTGAWFLQQNSCHLSTTAGSWAGGAFSLSLCENYKLFVSDWSQSWKLFRKKTLVLETHLRTTFEPSQRLSKPVFLEMKLQMAAINWFWANIGNQISVQFAFLTLENVLPVILSFSLSFSHIWAFLSLSLFLKETSLYLLSFFLSVYFLTFFLQHTFAPTSTHTLSHTDTQAHTRTCTRTHIHLYTHPHANWHKCPSPLTFSGHWHFYSEKYHPFHSPLLNPIHLQQLSILDSFLEELKLSLFLDAIHCFAKPFSLRGLRLKIFRNFLEYWDLNPGLLGG